MMGKICLTCYYRDIRRPQGKHGAWCEKLRKYKSAYYSCTKWQDGGIDRFWHKEIMYGEGDGE
jgi:hypothetical protein